MLRVRHRAVRSHTVPTTVAIDTGPLVGPRSGVGAAVAHLVEALRVLEVPPHLVPYVISFRATLDPGITRLPLPAALAHRVWARADHPRVDRFLGRPAVIHGTNYVVPPAHSARLVSVYDCWFLRNPTGVHPDVARAGDVLRRSVRNGAVVHASSEATAAWVRELLGAPRVEVIPLGTIRLRPPPSERPADVPGVERPFVLALGTVERRKNLPVLVRAFGEAAGAAPELDLVIAGAPGNDSAAVAATVAALPAGVRSRVHVLGRVGEPAKSWLLHRARVLAYPSLDEGFGFPILEAFAAGTPVAASTAGSIPEIAAGAAVLVAPDDVAGLATALVGLHTDDTGRSAAVSAGSIRAAAFDWTTTARRMSDLYDALAMETRR